MKAEQQPNKQQQLKQQKPPKQQQDNSDGYVATSQYGVYTGTLADRSPNQAHQNSRSIWRNSKQLAAQSKQQMSASGPGSEVAVASSGSDAVGRLHQANGRAADNYQQYNPYPIYNDQDDVWLSEERLFEDHLEEIFNKWRLLDDDIWCKLIIMERNRRIGKAYARVPIVTIDGSPELSYDGYKLALNGFDSPHRDAKIEDCRKRIGKGIRIKMDNFGNILIKRLSKAGVYIKEWTTAGQLANKVGSGNKGSSNRVMPSRQQLIKNHCTQQRQQNGGLFSPIGRPTSMQLIYSTNSLGPASSRNNLANSENSSLESIQNSSSICDEIIGVGGRLEQDKIYVIFDMKKFQRNISQELCYPYPDRRKLERQCFSIIGLVRDSNDILSLPCWVMVINIVAIEMLNERFSQITDHAATSFPDTMLLMDDQMINSRDYTTIYSNNTSSSTSSGINTRNRGNKQSLRNVKSSIFINGAGKMEDPYTLPANASSSEMKSGTDDYGTTTTTINNKGNLPMNSAAAHSDLQASRTLSSGYYGSILSDGTTTFYRSGTSRASIADSRTRSKSSCNIRGCTTNHQQVTSPKSGNRYTRKSLGGGSSIYSPGHMLLQGSRESPVGPTIPPKLPPRDFVNRNYKTSIVSSKSSNQINTLLEPPIDYNSNQEDNDAVEPNSYITNMQIQKTRKSKFLDSPTKVSVTVASTLERTKSSQKSSSEVDNTDTVNAVTKTTIQSISADSSTGSDSLIDSKTIDGGSSGTGSSGAINKSNNNVDKDNTTSIVSGGNKPTKTSSKTSVKGLKLLLTGSLKGSGSADSTIGSPSAVDIRSMKKTGDGQSSGNSSRSSDYVQVDGKTKLEGANYNDAEVDSVVDPNELVLLDDSRQMASSGDWQGGRYNGLDIPTPDYEVDENVYAFGHDEVGSSYNRGFTSLSASSKNDTMTTRNQRHFGTTLNGARTATKTSMAYINSNNNNTNNSNISKDDLYHSGFRSHTPQNMSLGNSARANEKLLLARDEKVARTSKTGDLYTSRAAPTRMSYGSSTIGSRYRSASMQRYQSRGPNQSSRYPSDTIYNLDPSDPHDVASHYATSRKLSSSNRATGNYTSTLVKGNHGSQYGTPANKINSTYTIGRSSSGIYNSGSSSSDYVDWNPQMRKFNSSGYLNSIFKSNNTTQARQSSIRTMINPLNSMINNNYANNDMSSKTATLPHEGYTSSISRQSRAKPAKNRLTSSSTLNKNANQYEHSNQQLNDGSAPKNDYRSYGTSKDDMGKSYLLPSRWLVT